MQLAGITWYIHIELLYIYFGEEYEKFFFLCDLLYQGSKLPEEPIGYERETYWVVF